MKSLTKNKQRREIPQKIKEKYFAPASMVSFRELTEGYFNMAYEIQLSSRRQVVLKIAPQKGTRIMTYEKNIMSAEVSAMNMAKTAGCIPVPEVIAYDDSCSICPSPCLFMEKLEGDSLNSIKSQMTDEQIDRINLEAGKICRQINAISCPAFGYPGQPEFQGPDWFSVFQKMLDAGIQDAALGHVDLIIPIHHLHQYLQRDRPFFAEVTEPKLVHWDCWAGNIFVKNGSVSGVIDWERSIWGDPLMEVGFRTYSNNAAFRKGYGLEVFTESQARRALWYDIYLLILVSLECEYRKYETKDVYEQSTQRLVQQFQKLQNF